MLNSASALNVDSELNGCHEASNLLLYRHLRSIYTYLHRSSNVMRWREFLQIPKRHRRTRSEARSGTGSIEGQGGVEVPRLTESTPDLRIGSSILPTPTLLAPHDQGLNGRQTTLPRGIHLTYFHATQTPTPFPIQLYSSPPGTKAASRKFQITPPNREQYPRVNPTGSPPHTPLLS